MARPRTGSLELRSGVYWARLTVQDELGNTRRPRIKLKTSIRSVALKQLSAMVDAGRRQ